MFYVLKRLLSLRFCFVFLICLFSRRHRGKQWREERDPASTSSIPQRPHPAELGQAELRGEHPNQDPSP